MSQRPLVFVIMDGVGITPETFGNAVASAYTPTLDYLMSNHPNLLMKAHGTAVGLPSDDDMGNSEVGHNALGCGQVYSQGAKLVNESIEDGTIFESETWKELVAYSKDHTMHFIGLLSDGNVHSNIAHTLALVSQAKKEGIKRV
ncbi:MAG: 2,3-bisphosphoglycerate-independent phosphoglycerate mutase, partial [Erysipelothrix sp.]|nr:2,3-bisphosphoglycerate-independent phosphoglycerate mutase [Erysipelothrix sp.]